jgi:hypothetical protein
MSLFPGDARPVDALRVESAADAAADRRGSQARGATTWRRRSHPEATSSRWLRATLALSGVAAVLVAVEAGALGLGPASVSSGLGEPLRMSIPVTLQPDEEVGCVQVRPHGDDLPSVYNTRSQVIRAGTQTRIEIRSPAAVDEPAVGLIVSVGCASPVARDYVLFLDPPAIAALASDDAPASSAPVAVSPPRRSPRVRQSQADADASGAPVASPDRTARPVRRRAPASAAAPAARSDGSVAKPSTRPGAASSRPRTPAGGDRLSVMPTEPPVVGRTASSPQPGVFPPPVSALPPVGASGVAATTTPAATLANAPAAAAATTSPAADATAGAAPSAPSSPADAEGRAREQALLAQQVALQAQIKTLSDQIAVLRVQTTSLAARNPSLEGTVFSPTLVWLLIALAAIAIIVAGWMAWRYTQLRRSLEGSAWWTSQTQDGEGLVDDEVAADGALAGAARSMPRPPTLAAETRSPSTPSGPTSSSVQISNIDRIRPTVRAPGSTYPAAMDTDFTVSDIEAAMATVRTIPAPRTGKSAESFEDSDFTAGLGGPTITGPFTDPPPTEAISRPATDEDLAHFMDLDIPPVQPLDAGLPSKAAPAPVVQPPRADEAAAAAALVVAPSSPAATTEPDLEFTFEPPNAFDPLASDSLKTTIIDRADPEPDEFAPASAPTALDFELPSPTQILSMTALLRDADLPPPRHGATALDDLFATIAVNSDDTILDLDDRDGSPLSGTEVDRLTSSMTPSATLIGSSGRNRLARLAELMAGVDEIATTDPLRAIAHLRQYVLRDEHVPTLFWLRLFELYKAVDKRPVHDALAEHFARRYHRPMVGWNETLVDRTPQQPLASMEDIDRLVEAQWGTEAGLAHLETLLCDRTQDDAIVFNAVLQKDLLDAAKIYPEPAEPD